MPEGAGSPRSDASHHVGPHNKKIGTAREAFTLSELFDRRARTQDMWGKEPMFYKRKFDEGLGSNTLVHKQSGLQVLRIFADIVNRTDKRFPPEGRDNVCVFLWTKRSEVPKLLKVGQNKQLWPDVLRKECSVWEEEVSQHHHSLHEASTATRTSATTRTSASSVSMGSLGAVAEELGPITRVFLGNFTTLEVEDFHQMAEKNGVRPFNDKEGYAHATKVHLVEMLTGRPFRDCLRDGTVESFEVGVPIYVPFSFLAQCRDAYGASQFPVMVSVCLADYSRETVTFWNDRLVDACAAGDPARVEECFANGAGINHQDVKGWTPLHVVANMLHDRAFREKNRKKQVLDILLKRKPNMHIRTLRGDLAVDLAEARGFELCAEVLRAENLIRIGKETPPEMKQDPPLKRALRDALLF
ncbi:unnamed protein product [Amoebophrya sp. A25]|nr:unnamed protein product [Amoebophrya sp. A25]|eukprot:GSA25T00021124001.1